MPWTPEHMFPHSLREAVPDWVHSQFTHDTYGVPLPNGWSWGENYLGNRFKLNLMNPELGIFVKWFAPISINFAIALHQALSDPEARQLETPFLRPELLRVDASAMLVFPYLEGVGEQRYGEIFSLPEKQIIAGIAKRNQLRTLRDDAWLPVALYNDRLHVLDPFDDSVRAMLTFLK